MRTRVGSCLVCAKLLSRRWLTGWAYLPMKKINFFFLKSAIIIISYDKYLMAIQDLFSEFDEKKYFFHNNKSKINEKSHSRFQLLNQNFRGKYCRCKYNFLMGNTSGSYASDDTTSLLSKCVVLLQF